MSTATLGAPEPGDPRPLVAGTPSNRGVWIFAGIALLGAAALFATLEARRSANSADPLKPAQVQGEGMILPPPEEVERRRQSGDPFVWKINQDLLRRRFPNEPEEQGSGVSGAFGRNGGGATSDSGAIIQVLREQLQSKDSQIRTLETQLDRKDDQIKSLNDRMHESNVLIGVGVGGLALVRTLIECSRHRCRHHSSLASDLRERDRNCVWTTRIISARGEVQLPPGTCVQLSIMHRERKRIGPITSFVGLMP